MPSLHGHTDNITMIAWSADDTLLASTAGDTDDQNKGPDNTARLWRVADSSPLHVLHGHTNEVTSVAFAPDGSIVASGSKDHTVKLWHVADGTLLTTLHGHTDAVTGIAFIPDGTLLISGAEDGTIRLWSVEP